MCCFCEYGSTHEKGRTIVRFIVTTENKAQFNFFFLDLLTFRQGKLICEACFNVLSREILKQ